MPSHALAAFCRSTGPDDAWLAALTPLERPDKANVTLIVKHLHEGQVHTRKHNLTASDAWRGPAWTYDFDGDGHDELVLSVDSAHDQLLRFHDGRIEPYPRPRHRIERFEELNGDGRLDPVFRVRGPLAQDCHGEPVDLDVIHPGITEPGGRFTLDHEAARARLRRSCPAPPAGALLEGSSEAAAVDRIRCARLWGLPRAEGIEKVLTECRPHRNQALSCQGPCRNLDVLLAVASHDPLVRLRPETRAPSRDAASESAAPVGGSGHLPPEVVQRIVRAGFARYRLCYETELRCCPNLQDRVIVHFVIGRDGTVTSARSDDASSAAPRVADCVARAFYRLSFPTPQGGAVSVSYPIVFSPGG